MASDLRTLKFAMSRIGTVIMWLNKAKKLNEYGNYDKKTLLSYKDHFISN